MAKGKNFSGNSNKNRNKSDFYQTPSLLVHDILDRLSIEPSDVILEPCCGRNAIVDVVANRLDNKLIAFDLEGDGIDFLEWQPDTTIDLILTNPPFRLAGDFLTKALSIASKVVFLLPLSYLHGKARFDTFYINNASRLSHVYVYTRYPLLTDELQTGKYNTGMMVYAWYVFDKNLQDNTEPVIRWIDNNHHIRQKHS